MRLRVIAYPPEGHSDAPLILGESPTLSGARQLVRQALGVRHLAPGRRYASPDEDVIEGWNSLPPSHPAAHGCAVLEITAIA